MSNMDVSSLFPLPCVLVILTIIDGKAFADIVPIAGDIGSDIAFPLDISNLSDLSMVVTKRNNHPCSVNLSMDCSDYCGKQMCLRNGSLEMKDLSANDEGVYQVFFGKHNKMFALGVCEVPPAISIHCLPDGRAELSCKADHFSGDSVYWTLNGKHLNGTDGCVKDHGGKMVILEKGVRGKLVCHRKNVRSSSSIELVCDDADLLKHPVFLILLAVCGGAAILLAILASVITCSCMRSKHNFIPVPAEDEKDEGVTLSAISSEGPKSPPNGDHCEATDALDDSSPRPDPETCQNLSPEPKMDPNSAAKPNVEPGPKMEAEPGSETKFREVLVDSAALEIVDDCFPDPIDA